MTRLRNCVIGLAICCIVISIMYELVFNGAFQRLGLLELLQSCNVRTFAKRVFIMSLFDSIKIRIIGVPTCNFETSYFVIKLFGLTSRYDRLLLRRLRQAAVIPNRPW